MNADEAKREATRILGGRLKAWGVDGNHMKLAENFMLDLALAGWLWMPPSNRPTNARAGDPDECRRHIGEHTDSCRLCPTEHYTHEQDPRPTTDTSAGVALREALAARKRTEGTSDQ